MKRFAEYWQEFLRTHTVTSQADEDMQHAAFLGGYVAALSAMVPEVVTATQAIERESGHVTDALETIMSVDAALKRQWYECQNELVQLGVAKVRRG